ncbi:MAG: DUF503 domain-containing protein [Candidatus Marinimicrobia bacterium]|nr:DUF503 domain-containing protein [Candidatus Neomarinimicrobiota bacterium]
MIIGLLQLDIIIPESNNLKEKRSTIKSIKETIRKRFNVSIAETGKLDKWSRSELSISKVSNEAKFIRQEFQKIQKYIESRYPVEIINKQEEVW